MWPDSPLFRGIQQRLIPQPKAGPTMDAWRARIPQDLEELNAPRKYKLPSQMSRDELVDMASDLAMPMAGTIESVGVRAIKNAGKRPALPMDDASRMARAEAQGFTRDVYHGSGTPIEFSELRPSADGLVGPLPYTTTSPSEAAEYAISRAKRLGDSGGAHVLPLKVRVQNPVTVDSANEFWEKFAHLGSGSDQSVLDALKGQGHDGIILRRGQTSLSGEPQDFVMPFDASQIRSRFAKFDPANVGKAGLMGTLAAALGLGGSDEKRR